LKNIWLYPFPLPLVVAFFLVSVFWFFVALVFVLVGRPVELEPLWVLLLGIDPGIVLGLVEWWAQEFALVVVQHIVVERLEPVELVQELEVVVHMLVELALELDRAFAQAVVQLVVVAVAVAKEP
jgi:hypothetical protein